MIDIKAFKTKYVNLKQYDLLKIIDESLQRFPDKTDKLIANASSLNLQEGIFYSINIRESFAFIFHDSYLNDLCHRMENVCKEGDTSNIDFIVKELITYKEIFIQDLKKLRKHLLLEN